MHGSSLAAGATPPYMSMTGTVVVVAGTSTAAALADDTFFFFFPLPLFTFVDLGLLVPL